MELENKLIIEWMKKISNKYNSKKYQALSINDTIAHRKVEVRTYGFTIAKP